MVTLYDDQKAMIERVTASLKRGHKSVLMQYPTGGGKSVMATEIVHRAVSKGNSVWFTVPRRELIRQMSATFSDFGVRHSYIAAGSAYSAGPLAHICSTDTVKGRTDRLIAPKLAVIDETHFGGDGLDRLIKWLKANGTIILGLSATPWKLSGEGLGKWYDDMVQGPSVRQLIDAGRLSEYDAFAPSTPDLSGIKIAAGDYAKGQLAERMEQDRVLIGNAVKHYKTHAEGKLNIAYCVSIAHSEIVAQSFRDAGITAAHIDGKTPDIERKRIIKAYAKREIMVLTNCELLTFGFDLASQVGMDVTVECMSDLRPTKSLALQAQKWGRVLRRKPYPAIIFDHANNFMQHGLPCDEREWTLDDRLHGVGTKGGERILPVKQCLSDANGAGCFHCHHPSPKCPKCGHVYEVQSREIEEVEGELEAIDKERLKREKKKEVWKAKSLDELKAIERERGYKPGWAMIQAKIRGIA